MGSIFKSIFRRDQLVYRKLDDDEDETIIQLMDVKPAVPLEGKDASASFFSRSNTRKRWFPPAGSMLARLTTTLNLLFLAINLAIFAKTCHKLRTGSDLGATWRDFPTETTPTSVDLSFYTDLDDPDHLYRRMPSSEVDTAWHHLGADRKILITREEVERAGVDVRSAMKAPQWMTDQMNTTGDRYLGIYDPGHHIHCLDMVRKAMFADHYYDTPQQRSDPFHWDHVIHCLDTVRQSLMCHADREVLVLAWGERQPGIWMDRKQTYQCTDWDAVQDWVRAREIPVEWLAEVERPADVLEIPMQKEWWALVPAIKAHMAAYPEAYSDFTDAADHINHEHGHDHHDHGASTS